jgi:predicted RNA binding protein YcfA (HicA-like mRNA interferase family)
MKGREFIRRLKRLGVRIDTKRDKGGHALATFHDRQTVVSIHGDADMPPSCSGKSAVNWAWTQTTCCKQGGLVEEPCTHTPWSWSQTKA